MTARVGPGGRLDWAPEPTVVADGAALESNVRVELAVGAVATVREVVVLGRYGQRGGRYTGGLEVVVVDGAPLLAHTTVLDGADPALSGPAGTAGAGAVGTVVRAGAGDARPAGAGETAEVRWAWTPLDGLGAVLLAVRSPAAVAAVLDAAVLDAAVLDAAVPAAAVPLGAPPDAAVPAAAGRPATTGRPASPRGGPVPTRLRQGHPAAIPADAVPAVPT